MSWDANRERALSIVVEYILDGLARVHWKKGRLADADMEVRRALRDLLPPTHDVARLARQDGELQQLRRQIDKLTAGQVGEAARDVLADEAKAQAACIEGTKLCPEHAAQEAAEQLRKLRIEAAQLGRDLQATREELEREKRRYVVCSARAGVLHDEVRGALRLATTAIARIGTALPDLSESLRRWRDGVFERTGLKP